MGYAENKTKRDWALNSSWGAYGLGRNESGRGSNDGSVLEWVV